LFNLSIHVCCAGVVLEEEDGVEEDELCPRASVFRERITTVIVSIIKNSIDNENNITEEEENVGILKIIYY
jgi:hypothetical protein